MASMDDQNDPMTQAARAVAELHTAYIKADATITVAVLSTLVKEKILSSEAVDQMLTELEQTYKSLPASGSECDQSADRAEAEAALLLLGVMRRRLFSSE
jgi:argininosuccinate lyase